MLLKCCTQYVSKFGKLSKGHMTEKGQSSSQFPRRAVLKNVQTIGQLHLFPMLIRLCSKSSKLGFRIMWTENFQMFKLGLEKAQEPEMKLSTFAGSYRKQENSRKTSTSVLLTTLKPLTVWITTNCGKLFKEMGIPDHLTCLLRNLYEGQEETVRTLYGTTNWFRIENGCLLSSCLFNLNAEHIMQNAGLDEVQTRWNQDCQEKYQPQICRWHHSNGRKQKGTKESLDEGEGGEWKSQLKTEQSKNEDHVIQSHYFMVNRRGKGGSCNGFSLLGL